VSGTGVEDEGIQTQFLRQHYLVQVDGFGSQPKFDELGHPVEFAQLLERCSIVNVSLSISYMHC